MCKEAVFWRNAVLRKPFVFEKYATLYLLVTYYGHVEVCKSDKCYAIRNIKVTHEKESGNITVVFSSPVALLDEFVSDAELDTQQSFGILTGFDQVHFRLVNFDPDKYSNYMNLFDIGIQQNTEAMSMMTELKFEQFPLNETQWNCSIKETVNMKICFCKLNYPSEFCSNRSLNIFNPIVIPNKDTYHIYGTWDTPAQRYEYYFKIGYIYNKTIYLSCATNFFFINKKLTYMELGVGTNMSVQQPDDGLMCRYDEVSGWLSNNLSHFTVFGNMFTYDEWKPLVSLDWLYLRKNYQPGNCSYIKEMRADGNVHSFCVCKRLNNTERYCGIQMQEKEILTTTRIIFRGTTKGHERTLITSFPSFMTDIDELLQTIQRLLHMETIPDEDINAVLLAMDTLLDTNSLITQETSSRLINFLEYLMKHSCCEIYFVGNRSFAVLRQSVNCATTNREKWPVLRDDLIKSDHLHRNIFGASIWIPYETVCYRNTSHESVLAYFMFYNQVLFTENHTISDNCEVNLHAQTNLPVLGAQYINNSEEVHQIFTNGEYLPMVNIMFNKEELPSPLHGLLRLAHWNSGKWSYTENTNIKVYEDKRIWEVNHLTDFTLVVDGIDMDPILCDIFLDYISMCLNCASTVSLLILTSITIRQRFSKTKSKYNHFQRIMSKFYGIRISYYISLTFLHFGFAMLADSRRLFWPFTCEMAAVILYWILLVCWVRPDYVIPAVILPVGILGLCSTCCFVTIFIRYVLQEKLFGVSLQRGSSSVKTIVRGSLSTNCPSSVSDMDTWLKYIDKASVIICMQLMLGLPWICQYFTLFVPRLTAAHYIFTIAVGSQGLMLMMVYCCRKIKNQYNLSNCKR